MPPFPPAGCNWAETARNYADFPWLPVLDNPGAKRMIRLATLTTLMLAGIAAPAAALDLSERLAVGAQIGTTGVGVEGLYKLNDVFVLRGAIEGFRVDHEVKTRDVTYDGTARWLTDSGMVDIHPMRNPFLVSVGAYYGRRDVRVRGVPEPSLADELAAADVGELRGRAKLSGIAPFVGIGWDTTFHSDRRWGFKARAGVIFSDEPDVDLRATGANGDVPEVQRYLREEEAEIEDDIDAARTWPLVQIGFNYRF